MALPSAALLLGLTAVLVLPLAAQASELVTTGAVNIRAGAGVDQKRIATLPPGASMSVDYCREGWCRGEALGFRGWVSARYLSVESEPQIETYVPPVITAPKAPAVKFPFVMPDRGFHDYGIGRAHKFERPIK
jgi:uncharacterized protein YraI